LSGWGIEIQPICPLFDITCDINSSRLKLSVNERYYFASDGQHWNYLEDNDSGFTVSGFHSDSIHPGGLRQVPARISNSHKAPYMA